MILTAIAAIAENRTIGNDNDLIWHLPDDLKHFKNKTKGHTIIMGRKTWDSFGGKPLPNRTHIVITRNAGFKAEGAIVVNSLGAALAAVDAAEEQPFIVGGGEIYRQAMPFVQRLELTIVHHNFEGDTTFPEYNKDEWELSSSEKHEADERHAYAFTFKQLNRKVTSQNQG